MSIEGVNMMNTEKKNTKPIPWYRIIACLVVGGLVILYTAGIIGGKIEKDYRIDAVHLSLIVLSTVFIVVLLYPEQFKHIKSLELSGFKLEMLEKMKERQAKQESTLENISLILPLLLPETERTHLLNLDQGDTKGYKGKHRLRTELRHLRSVGLLKMRQEHHVSHMKTDMEFDLAEYMELTSLGKDWVKRIRDIEKDDKEG